MKDEFRKEKIIYIILIIILITAGILLIIVNKKPRKNNNIRSQTARNQSQKQNIQNNNIENNISTEKNEELKENEELRENEELKINEELKEDEDFKENEYSIEESSDIFEKYYKKAENLLQTMTLQEKVGQMFLARFPTNGVIEQIEKYNPSGYILFAKDFENETKSSILKKLQECQNSSKIKLIFGVDEEGGKVVRVSKYSAFRSSNFLSPQQLWEKGQLQAILQDSTEKSELLKSIGLNMNLTPVADVPTKSSSFIYKRSYGKGAEETAIYVSSLIKTMNNDGMISVIKHFPGYGDNIDTHTGVAVDKREYNVFKTSDFLPFISGIEAGAPCILVNHNIVNSMDSARPASLSQNVHNILRNELKFSGIIMTDDLAMDAVKKYAENGEAATQAVLAGNDIIISTDFIKQKQEIINAVNQGKISVDKINEAVRRILAWKYMYKIIS